MKLKALLLGSAAAMIAVSGARAADAVIAEPEPVEYVRVCDMYGNGFFYIPGTETCLAFSGYVRSDYTYNDNDGARGNQSTSRWDYRVRFNIDARNETDWGTLRSQIRFQGDGDGGGDAAVGVDRALISLAGFRLGYSDNYTTTHHGYGNPVEKYDGYYGYDQAIFFDYTYAANGFSATVGVQDSVGNAASNNHVNIDYYAGIGYSNSLFNLAASYIYEDAANGGAWKVSASVTPVDGLFIKGWYVGDEDNRNTRSVRGTGDYAWGVGASYQMTDTLNARAAWTDGDTGNEGAATIGLNWTPVPGLAIRPEIEIRENTGQSYSVRVYRTF